MGRSYVFESAIEHGRVQQDRPEVARLAWALI